MPHTSKKFLKKKSFVVQFVHYALGTESNGMQQGVRELLEVQSSDAVVIEYRNDQTNNMQKPITCSRSDKVSHSCDVQMGIYGIQKQSNLSF